jgi:hypothetical protein
MHDITKKEYDSQNFHITIQSGGESKQNSPKDIERTQEPLKEQ